MPTIKDLETGSYSFEEIAQLYAVSTVTLRKWLTPYMDKIGKPEKMELGELKYSTRQMQVIKNILMPEGNKG